MNDSSTLEALTRELEQGRELLARASLPGGEAFQAQAQELFTQVAERCQTSGLSALEYKARQGLQASHEIAGNAEAAYREARTCLGLARALEERDWLLEALAQASALGIQTGRTDEAEGFAREAYQALDGPTWDPTTLAAFLSWVRCRIAQGEPDAALEALLDASARNPPLGFEYQVRIQLEMAALAAQRGDLESAQKTAASVRRRCRERGLGNLEAAAALAEISILLDAKKFEPLLEVSEEALDRALGLELYSTAVEITRARRRAFEGLKQPKKAIEALRNELEILEALGARAALVQGYSDLARAWLDLEEVDRALAAQCHAVFLVLPLGGASFAPVFGGIYPLAVSGLRQGAYSEVTKGLGQALQVFSQVPLEGERRFFETLLKSLDVLRQVASWEGKIEPEAAEGLRTQAREVEAELGLGFLASLEELLPPAESR